jgi:hypothetical protein
MCRIGRNGLVESAGRLDSVLFIVHCSDALMPAMLDHVSTANTE